MERLFVESSLFTNKISKEKDKDLLKRIQQEILANPKKGDLIEGTGGIRKIRVAKHDTGKSGAYRVFYLDLPSFKITHLFILLLKGEAENITSQEKKQIKNTVDEIKKEIRSRGKHGK